MKQPAPKLILGLAVTAAAVLPLSSQTVPAQKQSFEVASIKPNNSDSRASRTFSGPDGSLIATNTNVRGLIRASYGVFDFQIVGGPDWINTARFDVEGRAQPGLAEPDVLAMTRSLLGDRFQLRVHREMRELPIFILTTPNGKSRLQPSVEGRPSPSGLRPGQSRTNVGSAGGELSGSGIGIAKLIEMLVSQAGRPIIDKTNLTGTYDFTLKFAPQNAPTDLSGPSFFTAIQEQLGLKLDAAKGPVEVLVIDSVQRPSEN